MPERSLGHPPLPVDRLLPVARRWHRGLRCAGPAPGRARDPAYLAVAGDLHEQRVYRPGETRLHTTRLRAHYCGSLAVISLFRGPTVEIEVTICNNSISDPGFTRGRGSCRRQRAAGVLTRECGVRVLHIISGDLWAGAEAQAFTQLSALHEANVTVAAALLNEGELAARLRARGVPVTVLDESRLSGTGILLALRRLMREWRPDIVHTHRTKENILGSLANRLAGNVPSVRTVHGASEDKSR